MVCITGCTVLPCQKLDDGARSQESIGKQCPDKGHKLIKVHECQKDTRCRLSRLPVQAKMVSDHNLCES